MTKSKGIGRGGSRTGAGRPPADKTVDWDALGRAYYTGDETIEAICSRFDIGYGDLLAHAASSHWMMRRPTRSHPDDLGDLSGALALQMYQNDDSAAKTRERFVAAMIALDADVRDIAEVLSMQDDMPAFRRQFAKQLAAAPQKAL